MNFTITLIVAASLSVASAVKLENQRKNLYDRIGSINWGKLWLSQLSNERVRHVKHGIWNGSKLAQVSNERVHHVVHGNNNGNRLAQDSDEEDDEESDIEDYISRLFDDEEDDEESDIEDHISDFFDFSCSAKLSYIGEWYSSLDEDVQEDFESSLEPESWDYLGRLVCELDNEDIDILAECLASAASAEDLNNCW